MHRLVTIAAVFTLTAVVAGCGSTPTSRFYSLSAATEPTAPSSNLSIAVGPVSVPAVVDRPQIVVNVGPNQVRLEEFNRWAAPLQNNIARVVADNLVLMLGTPRVILSEQLLSADVDYRAAIEVQSSNRRRARRLCWTRSGTSAGRKMVRPKQDAPPCARPSRRKAMMRLPPPIAARSRN